MSDFEEGFAVGYVLGKKKHSPIKKYDPIFHDILENSETFCTIIIDDVYKFTLNLWVLKRNDVPYSNSYGAVDLTAVEAEGVGYSQNIVTHSKSVQVYKILWKNNKPMYAAFIENDFPFQSFEYVKMPQNYDSAIPFKYYLYHDSTYEYIKGSAVATCDSVLHIKPNFSEGMYGTKILNFFNVKIVDANENSVSPRCAYKLKHKIYKEVYQQTGWGNDNTKPPKIIKDKEKTEIGEICHSDYFSNSIFIDWVSPTTTGATFSDLSEKKLNSLTNKLVQAICERYSEKYNDKSCYTHVAAKWLKPEK